MRWTKNHTTPLHTTKAYINRTRVIHHWVTTKKQKNRSISHLRERTFAIEIWKNAFFRHWRNHCENKWIQKCLLQKKKKKFEKHIHDSPSTTHWKMERDWYHLRCFLAIVFVYFMKLEIFYSTSEEWTEKNEQNLEPSIESGTPKKQKWKIK